MSTVNLIQSIYLNKAKSLLNTLENSSITEHNPTTGALRENAIIDSLKAIIPHEFKLNSGFVVDVKGLKSPQLDIIAYKRGDLPSVLLSNDSVILPFELFHFCIEVKTTLTKGDFKQINKQTDSLKKMVESSLLVNKKGIINNMKINESRTVTYNFNRPFLIVIAVDTNVKIETIQNEIDENDGLFGVYVIKQGLFDRGGNKYQGADEIENIMKIWSHIFIISQLAIERKNKFLKGEYDSHILDEITKSNLSIRDDAEDEVLRQIKKRSLITYLYAINDQVE